MRNPHETATQSVSQHGIPVPPGGTFQGRPPRGRRNLEETAQALVEESWAAESRTDRRAEVVDVTWLTRTGTLRLGFEVVDDLPFSFEPGNFVRLEPPGVEAGPRRRPYCISSPPSEYRRFDLIVRVVSGGRLSARLATLRLGDEVAFRGPTGRSMLKSVTAEGALALIGTGVGVGPLWSLAATVLRSDPHRRVELFWGLRSADDVFLTTELDRLASVYPGFSYRISLSQPPPGWTGLSGRVTESVPPLIDDPGERRYVLTGNGAMIEELVAALGELGVARDAIHQEAYFNPRHVADPAVVAAIVERFRGAGPVPGQEGACARPGPTRYR